MGAMDDQQIARRRKGLSIAEGKPESPSRPQRKSRNDDRRRRRRPRNNEEEPFWKLFIKVGVVVFIAFVAMFHIYRWFYPVEPPSIYNDDDALFQAQNLESESKKETAKELDAILAGNADDDGIERVMKEKLTLAMEEAAKKTAPPIPTFKLGDSSKYDAFGMTKILQTINRTQDDGQFWETIESMKSSFADLYGGENAARMMLDKGLSTFPDTKDGGVVPSDITSTACRMARAKEQGRPFAFAFAGYSVTAGRGNHFRQSFPFVMKELLQTAFQQAGLEIEVRNAAIGGCPAFPYGWCLRNFLGENPDVISWDYAMNEAGGVPEGLEAYIRHTLTLFTGIPPPKLLVKDTHMAIQRQDVIKRYVQNGLLLDPLVIHSDPAARPFLERAEQDKPFGFQEWRKFGGPVGGPGQTLHHPAVKEHEMLGWLLSMHFIQALQVYVHSRSQSVWSEQCQEKFKNPSSNVLIPPVSGSITNITDFTYPSALFGVPTKDGMWRMNPIQCSTTFEPRLSGDLKSMIVAGTVGEDINLLFPKSHMYYNDGWTLDLSEGEKSAKKNLQVHDGLEFVDSKEAYYGIVESGKMSILVPYRSASPSNKIPAVGDEAKDWFISVIVCQVNEKRNLDACNAETDITYHVGGVNVTASDKTMLKEVGTLFLGKKLCTSIAIPDHAKITSFKEAEAEVDSRKGHKKAAALSAWQHLKQEDAKTMENTIGIMLEIAVSNQHLVHIPQACSVSHVVWEQQPLY